MSDDARPDLATVKEPIERPAAFGAVSSSYGNAGEVGTPLEAVIESSMSVRPVQWAWASILWIVFGVALVVSPALVIALWRVLL